MAVKYLQQHPQFNFQLKFLKFKKWCLDGYKIIRVMNIHFKKKGHEEGFRGPCWLGDRYRDGGGGTVEANTLSLPILVLGWASNSTQRHL